MEQIILKFNNSNTNSYLYYNAIVKLGKPKIAVLIFVTSKCVVKFIMSFSTAIYISTKLREHLNKLVIYCLQLPIYFSSKT